MAKQSSGRIELLQGTLDMLILRTFLFGPAHGHQIAKHIQNSTEDLLQVEHGSLYPALHRLERKGWLVAKWEPAAKDQKREYKFYRLTAAGRKLTRHSRRSGWGVPGLQERIPRPSMTRFCKICARCPERSRRAW